MSSSYHAWMFCFLGRDKLSDQNSKYAKLTATKKQFFFVKKHFEISKIFVYKFSIHFFDKILKKMSKITDKIILIDFFNAIFFKSQKNIFEMSRTNGVYWFNWPNSCLKEYFTSMLDFPKWNGLTMKFSSPLTKIGAMGAILISFKYAKLMPTKKAIFFV